MSQAIRPLSQRWDSVKEQWWLDEFWDVCKEIPEKALIRWVTEYMRYQRNYPVPGDFQRWFWDHSQEYKVESDNKGEPQGCSECIGIGFVWATDHRGQFCFRCTCELGRSKPRHIPLWNEKYTTQGFVKDGGEPQHA